MLLTIVSAGIDQEAQTYNVAVVDMKVSGGIPETYALAFTDRLRHELFNTGVFSVMERSEMEEILTEQGFQLSGCTTDQCYIEAGRILNVDHIVAGSVCQIGSLYSINLRLISVETAKTEKSVVVDYQGEVEQVLASQMKEAALELAGKEGGGKASIVSSSLSLQTIDGPLPGMTFAKILAGFFIMGSNDGNSDEKPVHEEHIKSFYMMTTEVTQDQWFAIMGSNPSYFRGDNLPVENVSWNDCQEFIKKLNQKDYGKNYRLPSEAEWEYACRAGTTTKFYSGNSNLDLDGISWHSGNFDDKTHPVGQKRANAWNLYDMSGNVWEWCQDWCHDSYSGAPNDGSSWGSPKSDSRVLRGGSWFHNPKGCRSSYRYGVDPDGRGNGHGGFRLARDL